MHKYKIGDVVHICNEYGIYLGKRKIVGLDVSLGKPRYFYENSDTPWFSVEEKCVSQDPEYILELMWNKLTYYRKEGGTC